MHYSGADPAEIVGGMRRASMAPTDTNPGGSFWFRISDMTYEKHFVVEYYSVTRLPLRYSSDHFFHLPRQLKSFDLVLYLLTLATSYLPGPLQPSKTSYERDRKRISHLFLILRSSTPVSTPIQSFEDT